MAETICIAASQFPVSGSVKRNAKYICNQISKAKEIGADVIHFPECAISGYAPKHFGCFESYNWNELADHTQEILRFASKKQIWIILGSIRKIEGSLPRICAFVISDKGKIVGIYDKRRLYKREKELFSPGRKPCIVEINGFKCGILVCYDNCFPELYSEYREAGVGLIFHSFHNAANQYRTSISDLMHANLLVRAADNQIWISASNSSSRYSPLSASIVRPDGSFKRARRNVSGLIVDKYPSHDLGWTYDNREP